MTTIYTNGIQRVIKLPTNIIIKNKDNITDADECVILQQLQKILNGNGFNKINKINKILKKFDGNKERLYQKLIELQSNLNDKYSLIFKLNTIKNHYDDIYMYIFLRNYYCNYLYCTPQEYKTKDLYIKLLKNVGHLTSNLFNNIPEDFFKDSNFLINCFNVDPLFLKSLKNMDKYIHIYKLLCLELTNDQIKLYIHQYYSNDPEPTTFVLNGFDHVELNKEIILYAYSKHINAYKHSRFHLNEILLNYRKYQSIDVISYIINHISKYNICYCYEDLHQDFDIEQIRKIMFNRNKTIYNNFKFMTIDEAKYYLSHGAKLSVDDKYQTVEICYHAVKYNKKNISGVKPEYLIEVCKLLSLDNIQLNIELEFNKQDYNKIFN